MLVSVFTWVAEAWVVNMLLSVTFYMSYKSVVKARSGSLEVCGEGNDLFTA